MDRKSQSDELLFATLIELADTTITGFDLISFADRLVGGCVDVLGATAAGIMLADQFGLLRVLASTNEETRVLELFELQNNDGPCLEAFRTGNLVEGVDLSRFRTRWPHFVAAALSAGFNTAYAVPLRLRDQTIGALNIFQAGTKAFTLHELKVARVMADMATIGIIHHWSIREGEVLTQQLQGALDTRVIIEQAKGVVAQRQGLSMGEAFEYLLRRARSAHRTIADIAAETVAESDPEDPAPGADAVQAGEPGQT